ncbi:hypothetical protein [Mesorhizobium sp. SP-1A]|uniref:hypothetical protein n=1 Tax=Mesorhizobium sp. SP-1A TaxID=3077840 RepID=UPI0028F704E3|nr:hypothetical protein [Mesorhizobium sp. SP-1A]
MATMAMSRTQNASFLKRLTSTLSDLTKNLMGTTSLVAPSMAATKKIDNPFGNFGVLASADKFKANAKPIARSSILFTIDDARKRISEFVENKFKPESIAELKEYLSERFLRLETWKLPPGPMNMLVDTKSSAATPAAAVDKRLSYWNMLEEKLRGDLRREIGTAEPAKAFGSWEGMSMSLSNSRGNIGYSVSKGQAYVGKVFADQNDRRTMHEIVAAAKQQGVELILPTDDGTINGRRVPGLPFLKKMESLKAEVVHSGLKHDALATAFGGLGLVETIESKIKSKQAREASLDGKTQESTQEFDLSQFLRKEPEPFAAKTSDPNVSSFGDFGEELEENYESTRNLSIRMYAETSNEFIVYDRDFDEATQIQFNDMPAGRYERENVHGVVEGYTEILEDGSLKHYDHRGNIVEFENKLEDKQDQETEYGSDLPKFGR